MGKMRPKVTEALPCWNEVRKRKKVIAMCQSGRMTRNVGMLDCACGCCGCGPSFRRFFSSEEERECLESYRDQLKKELAGVEERISELKSKRNG